MRYEYIFWDWNGTLLDDAVATCDAVNSMLIARSLPVITLEQYRDLIEVPIIGFYKKVMDISGETMESISEEFHARWAEHLSSSPIMSDAVDILNRIKESGRKQYIFSSTQNKLIAPFLTQYGITSCFECVLGAPDCHVGSKVERTRSYLEQNGIPKEKALFIGDMVHDSEVASAIGSECLLVYKGHQSEKALRATGRKVVASLSDVFAYLNNDNAL